MWSYQFTSERSRFAASTRVGFHARPAKVVWSSEAAVSEALELALAAGKFDHILVDKGAELAVRSALRGERSKAARARSSVLLVCRLNADCHRKPGAALVQLRQAVAALGVDGVDGVLVPWPPSGGGKEEDDDPLHMSPECKRQKELFLQTWAALEAVVKAGPPLVKWLGVDALDTWHLERCCDAWQEGLMPAANLVAVSLTAPNRRTIAWSQSRNIEVFALLDSTNGTLEAQEDRAAFSAVREGLLGGTLDTPTLLLVWALQHLGVVAFPSLGDVLEGGDTVLTARDHGDWAARAAALLASRTLGLHSPTEYRRTFLQGNVLAALDALDTQERAKRQRLDALLSTKLPKVKIPDSLLKADPTSNIRKAHDHPTPDTQKTPNEA